MTDTFRRTTPVGGADFRRTTPVGGADLRRTTAAGGANLRRTAAAGSSLSPLISRGTPMSLDRKLGGFALSTLESFPELFGIEPSKATQEFRAVAPISGIASQVLGAFVPYLGAARVARALPGTGRFIRGAEAFGRTRGPIAAGAMGMAAEGVVVEAARVGLGASGIAPAIYQALTGRDAEQRRTSTLVGEGLFNIAGGAALGGLVGGVSSRLARGIRLEGLAPEAARDLPRLQQIRGLNDRIAMAQDPANSFKPGEESLARLARERDLRVRMAREGAEPAYTDTGDVQRSGQYTFERGQIVRPLVGDKAVKGGRTETQNFLNRAMRFEVAGETKRLASPTRNMRPIIDQVSGFLNEADQLGFEQRFGMSIDDMMINAQDVRIIRTKVGSGRPIRPEGFVDNPDARRLGTSVPEFAKQNRDPELSTARGLQRRFANRSVWTDVGQGYRMAREADGGMYVFVKKTNGDPVRPGAGDEYAIFRTDKPGEFATKAAAAQDLLINSGFYAPVKEVSDDIGEAFFDANNTLERLLGNDLVPKAEQLQRFGKVGDLLGQMKGSFSTYVAPTMIVAARNVKLARGIARINYLNGKALAEVNDFMYGRVKLDPSKSVARSTALLDPQKTTIAFGDFIDTLSKRDFDQIQLIEAAQGLNWGLVQGLHSRGIISDNVMKFFLAGKIKADDFAARVEKLKAVVTDSKVSADLEKFKSRQDSWSLSRTFDGGEVVLLTDVNGNVRGWPAGTSPGEARAAAKAVIEREARSGRVVFEGGLISQTIRTVEDFERLARSFKSPGLLKARGNQIGYTLQQGDLNAKKLKEIVERNLKTRANYIRDIVIREKSAEDLILLGRENGQDALRLQKAIEINAGNEGAFSAAQNLLMDKALNVVGLSGNNSASKIVRVLQKTLTAWTFGFGHMPQLALNMYGIAQNLLPHVSYVLNASPEVLARHYTMLPNVGENGAIRGAIGVLSPVKLIRNGLARAVGANNEPEWLATVEELVSRGVISPRFAEEQFGASSKILTDFSGAMKSGENMLDYAVAANQLGMAKTEELARVFTAAVGYELGKLAGLEGERLIYFIQEMVGKVNYGYNAVDRALIHTTPLGSLSGTFKNWVFHYMGTMYQYASGGKEALPAFMWQTAATALIGGAAATPLVQPIADAFSKWATDRTAMENLYAATNNAGLPSQVADGVMYGLPGAMGLSFSSQASAPLADPERDASMLFSMVGLDRMKALSSGTKQALLTWQATGESPWEDEAVRRNMVRALAPRTFFRAMAVAEDTAVQSMGTGYSVTRPLGLGSALLYTAGFNPTELDKTYEVYNRVRSSQEKKRALVKEMGASLAQAWENGDERMANRIFTRSVAIGLDSSSVLRSARARTERAEVTQLEFASKGRSVDDLLTD